MNERVKSLLIYAAKCITATLLVFIIAHLLGYKDIAWSLISVLLVLSPEGTDAVTLAVTRIKANIVGASVGLLCLLFSSMNMWNLSLALMVTLSLCYLFKFDSGAKSALAATVIIMLHEEGRHLWDAAIERVIAVLAGCVLGLLITFIFHSRIWKDKNDDELHHEA
ncbi:MAG: FUSC family protein [Ferruginibacter sp.]